MTALRPSEAAAATAAREASRTRFLFQPAQRDTWTASLPLAAELCAWAARLDEAGLTPEAGGASLGNLSFRTTRGFAITPTRTLLKAELSPEQLAEVVRVEPLGGEQYRIHYLGPRVPSSDAILHHLVYARRPDVLAVFHGHDDVMLRAGRALGIPYSIEELPFGTYADAASTVAGLGDAPAVLRRGHGFLTVGNTLERAGRLALELHARAQDLLRRGLA